MGTEFLLHPHYIMPLTQFKAGRVEMGDRPVPQSLMKCDTCRVGESNAGAEIGDMLSAQTFFQSFIESAANTSAMFPLSYINRCFHRPAICSPRLKCRSIGIT